MKPITRCPMCGSRRVQRMLDTLHVNAGGSVVEVTDVEFDRCSNCGEQFFDHLASERIDAAMTASKRRPVRRKSA